jgi:pyruvate/2-oxoglutarate dehydrogenase complex dihydrolipoamide dehydrogenase (E3) component
MSADREVDVVVIGAGPAGEVCAGRLADHGLEVALVESDLIGGECSYYACMPSKGLLRPGELMAEARRVPGVREAITGELDVQSALDRRDETIHDLDDSGQVEWLDRHRVALIRGRGGLDGERRVVVGGQRLTVRRAVVVATGSGTLIPPLEGLAEARPWTNREATTAKSVPERLLILGGGMVGVEMAQAWSSLGCAVTLVEALPRLISREEEFASEQVADALRERGVDVRTGAEATAASRADGEVTLRLEGGDELTADELLVAIGRRPHTDDLGLETVGMQPGEPIEVDDRMRSSRHEWLYAIGDVNGRSLLTHMGKYQARLLADHLGTGADIPVTQDGPVAPRVIFTDPQVAAVGHTLASAREAGMNVRAVDGSTAGSAGASYVGRNTAGTSRLVVDEERKVIVGATFVGVEVADWLHAATIAVVGEVPIERLRHAVPAFPTRSEVWLYLLQDYWG